MLDVLPCYCLLTSSESLGVPFFNKRNSKGVDFLAKWYRVRARDVIKFSNPKLKSHLRFYADQA